MLTTQLVHTQDDVRDALRKHVPKLAMLHPEIEKAVLGTTPAPRRSLPKAPRFRRVQLDPSMAMGASVYLGDRQSAKCSRLLHATPGSI